MEKHLEERRNRSFGILVYQGVAGMWVFKAHHIFKLHFACFFFNVKFWSLKGLDTPTVASMCRFSSAPCRLPHRGCLFLLWHVCRTMEMSHLGNGGRKDPVCLDHPWWSQKYLNGGGTVSKGMNKKDRKIHWAEITLIKWSNNSASSSTRHFTYEFSASDDTQS